MAAYFVLMQEVRDIDRYRTEYLPRLRPFLAKYGAEVLVAGFDAESAEGEPPQHRRAPLFRCRGGLGTAQRP